MTHRPDCSRTGWTETTSHTGTKTWRCNDCGATTIPTPLAELIAGVMAHKTPDQGINDLIEHLGMPGAVSVSAGPVREGCAPRAGENQSLSGGIVAGQAAQCYVSANGKVA